MNGQHANIEIAAPSVNEKNAGKGSAITFGDRSARPREGLLPPTQFRILFDTPEDFSILIFVIYTNRRNFGCGAFLFPEWSSAAIA
jgi:hypothetical protein